LWFKTHSPGIPKGSTPFRQAVAREPIDCVRDDVVLAYKLYYAYYKSHLAKWRHSRPPGWYSKMRDLIAMKAPVCVVEAAAYGGSHKPLPQDSMNCQHLPKTCHTPSGEQLIK